MNPVAELALFTDDVAKLTAFYAHVLGAEPAFQTQGMALFQAEGFHLLIHQRTTVPGDYELEGNGPPNEDHFAVKVGALEESWRSEAWPEEQRLVPPKSYPWGKSAYLRDPDGRLVELQEG